VSWPVDPRRLRDRTSQAASRSAELQAQAQRLRTFRGTPARPAAPFDPHPPAFADDPLRRVAELEEMVARTHERAAQLYETWSAQQVGATLDGLEQQARRHREMAAASRSAEGLIERTVDGFVARVDTGTFATVKVRHLVALAALERLRTVTSLRIADTVSAGRREGATWAEIAAALGVTRQTAHERFRRRGD
jgi:hypothetical protein